MPTYDFKCNHCGHHFEVFRSITDESELKCPKCGKDVDQIIGKGSGIIFKGSGFYITDYKKKNSVS